ncbi:DUF3300 domain-containing protein [Acuticoccus sp. I52.16.1]|uniref:DUF3300 domain-containing protein n=1 Tax=Acuticoccus sp. I52.16.1 TaxID=2928472 RepID=UPI001FD0ACF4|nr:DUF3300 domain-containing protein [Acuticoccus sp. I52.16.1]UOM36430.1 DUF3300 domain-containing protein [Acuticoccus sp. I52.16.1]
MRSLRSMTALAACFLAATAHAVPGVTTSSVNFRTGPGTNYDSLGVLPSGTTVDIVDCNDGGTWCSVTAGDAQGFVSGNYLTETALPVAEPTGTDLVEPTGDVAGADGALLGDDELDTLVARIALYPDNLVAQLLVAATYPLEVVKAGRWVEANKDLPADQREAAANAEGWDESVAMLAAGFPTVIEMLNQDLDWTEALGDAMLAQSDGVLDAVQRQRARAQSVGNLESNEAQVVDTVNNTIVIEPAQPDKVYVPAYDPVTTYTTPAPAQPVYVETTDSGWNTGAVLATGAIAFGTGLAISSIYNDNYRDYWYGPPRVHWDNHYVYPRPGYRPPPRPGWGPRPGRPGYPPYYRPDRPGGPDRPGRPGAGWPDGPGGRPDRPGRPDVGRPGHRPGGDNPGAWKPDDRKRHQARQSIENRHNGQAGRPGTNRPAANRPAGNRPAGNRPAGNRPNAGRPGGRPNQSSVEQRLKAGSGSGNVAKRPAGQGGARATAPRKGGSSGKALSKPRNPSAGKTRQAASRGKASSAKRAAAPRRPAASKNVSRPKAARAPQRHAAPKRTAMHKSSHGGRARAAGARGKRGGGGRRRR